MNIYSKQKKTFGQSMAELFNIDYDESTEIQKFELTQEIVKYLFDYQDGNLYWKVVAPANRMVKLGDVAGWNNPKGYRHVLIFGKDYSLHSVVFLWHYGYKPEFVDHIDNDRSNNKIENLRECNHQQNCLNRGIRPDSVTGVKCVKLTKYGTFLVRVTNPKTKIREQLGTYKTIEEAKLVAEYYIKKYHGEFANIG